MYVLLLLEIAGKPVGMPVARTHAQTDRQPENIMHPVPSIGMDVGLNDKQNNVTHL